MKTSISNLGDVWLIGPHRLMCGDATSPDDISQLMQWQLANLCFTSPPYGHQRQYKSGIGDWDALMQGTFANVPMALGGQILVNLGLIHRGNEWQPYWDGWIEWMRSAGWRRFGWYVWHKGVGLPGSWKGRLAPAHEFIFHFNKASRFPNKTKAKKKSSIGDSHGPGILRRSNGQIEKIHSPQSSLNTHRIPDSVIFANSRCARGIENEHPAVFPVNLCKEIIEAYSNVGDVLYEPFCGSGSQIVAAHRLDRVCYAMEIEPTYCDIAIRRIEHDTGLIAFRASDGVAFCDVRSDMNDLIRLE